MYFKVGTAKSRYFKIGTVAPGAQHGVRAPFDPSCPETQPAVGQCARRPSRGQATSAKTESAAAKTA